ncbi:MAG: hypothetical protein B7Z37_27980 [Verrucomicrobia bacterium 12-59-8]|nr:MAG: hypothetical protein B7Z37_27980 [Verrucomicrobia bacterium 12-59-8]
MHRKLPAVLLLSAALATTMLLPGCVIAALGAGIGAGVGAVKYGSAKEKEAYTHYRVEMERVNLDRERSGLMPTRIASYDEWSRQ